MKNRMLLSILIVFIILVGLWISCGTVFVVREIDVEDYNPELALLSENEKAEIASRSALAGKNILFNFDTNSVESRLKAINPLWKVQNIKAEFPNKVVIKIAQRVPIYYDHDLFLDAEMCMVEGTTAAGYVDISGARINFADPTRGNPVTGVTERDNRKIEQLKVVAGYFKSLKGWQLEYDDRDVAVGADRLQLQLTLGPNVRFSIRTCPDEDFARLLAYTNSVYRTYGLTGDYQAFYGGNGLACVFVDGVQMGVFCES